MDGSAQSRHFDGVSSRRRLVLPVGQEDDQAELLEDLSAAIDGDGRVVVIGGEAGIGKTTLVRSLAGVAGERNVRVLETSCFELYSTPAFGPWLDLFANLDQDPALPAAPAGFAGGSMQRVTDQAALFASVRDYFIELTRVSPVLLVLEDLHWSDPASLDLLRDLSRRARRMRMMMVITYRTDDLDRSNPFYQRLPVLVRETECRRIELQRLDRDQLRTLVETWMDLSQSDSNRLVDYLALHSDGNPFYATELMRTLHDRGLLAHRAGGWELAALDQLVLPPLLVHVIDSRISRLGNAMREWLAIAAVIGQEVPLPVWLDVAGMHEDQLLATVERAIDAHVMEANDQGSSVRFVHALTRNAL
jgi:predicted ATPase